MARVGDRYLVAGSGVHGWRPTETQYALAASPLGPYGEVRVMSREKTWRSQITDLVPLGTPGGRLMVMCDQWYIPDPDNLNRSRYLWLPVAFDAAGDTACMDYADSWRPLD